MPGPQLLHAPTPPTPSSCCPGLQQPAWQQGASILHVCCLLHCRSETLHRAARLPPPRQVTCNYAARQQGVTKLMGTAEARKRCPHIALVRWVLVQEAQHARRGGVSMGQHMPAGKAAVQCRGGGRGRSARIPRRLGGLA